MNWKQKYEIGLANGLILKRSGFNKTSSLKGRGRARMLVRIRDKFTCQDCGDVRTSEQVKEHNKQFKGLKGRIKLFDVHHLNGMCGKNSRGYDTTLNIDGLITLCHKCHYNRPEHNQRLTQKYRGKSLTDILSPVLI